MAVIYPGEPVPTGRMEGVRIFDVDADVKADMVVSVVAKHGTVTFGRADAGPLLTTRSGISTFTQVRSLFGYLCFSAPPLCPI